MLDVIQVVGVASGIQFAPLVQKGELRTNVAMLRSIGINIEIAKLAGKPVALVINAAPAQGAHVFAAVRDASNKYGVEVCPIIVHQRAMFGHALVQNKCAQEVEPASKAAAEVAALWDWLAQRARQDQASSMAAAMTRLSA